MSTPQQPLLTIASAVQVQAGHTVELLPQTTRSVSIFGAWLSISAATSAKYSLGIQTWGASITDQAGNALLRVQVHLGGPNQITSEASALLMAGIPLDPETEAHQVVLVTDRGVSEMYTRANGGISYSFWPN